MATESGFDLANQIGVSMHVPNASMLEPSNTTITFFEGDAGVAAKWIHERVRKLLLANPWLAGRLHQPEGSDVQVRMPTSKADPSHHVVELNCPDLRPDLPFAAMGALLGAVKVSSGAECLRNKQPLFKIGLLRQEEMRFAVVVSLSRPMGDGFVFHKIYEGLGQLPAQGGDILLGLRSPSQGANKLAPRRREEIKLASEMMSWGKSLSLFFEHLAPAVNSDVSCNAWAVDAEWVASVKASIKGEQADAPMISTHDILTSWFGQRGGYEHLFMTVNFRERIPSMNKLSTGNYDSFVHLWPSEFATPLDVKRAYKNPSQGFQTERNEAMGNVLAASSNALGAVYNIASVSADLVLPACQKVLHLPVPQSSYYQDVMYIFWARPAQLAVAIQSNRAAVEWEIAPSPVGARLV